MISVLASASEPYRTTSSGDSLAIIVTFCDIASVAAVGVRGLSSSSVGGAAMK